MIHGACFSRAPWEPGEFLSNYCRRIEMRSRGGVEHIVFRSLRYLRCMCIYSKTENFQFCQIADIFQRNWIQIFNSVL